MTMSSTTNTPKNSATPLRLGSRRRLQAPPETPECFSKVTVETPGPPKKRPSKHASDEVRNLSVAVRIRPMNNRELNAAGVKNVVSVEDQDVIVSSVTGISGATKSDYVFPYDHVFSSCDQTSSNFSSQEDVFDRIGKPLLNNAFQGYHSCLFAYGQTGSGKSYSMMGADSQNIDCDVNAGIIPRFCKELFRRISQFDAAWTTTVDVSYFEIYNEKIHDLLSTNCSRFQHTPLKVREHQFWGPYVVDLSTHTVKSYEELRSWLVLGNSNRATAATAMNEKSSRSHSIFSVELSILEGTNDGEPGRRSKVSLVDLAGSERLGHMKTKDEKLKQGVYINKSLLTLGKVISALADQRKGNTFVPYRESVLTWLLRESLGGNSLTCMLATITPASTHLDETLATLRYACQARSIVNRAHINEQPHDRLIRQLKSEVERLKTARHDYEEGKHLLSNSQIDNSTEYLQELEILKSKLFERENDLRHAEECWANRYKESNQHQLQELAEMQRKKEELESRVRVMSNLDTNISLSPYQTNFLEEVENILTVSDSSVEEVTEYFGNMLHEHGFNYQLASKADGPYLDITDSENGKRTSCSLNDVRIVLKEGNAQTYIKNLNWKNIEEKLNESQIHSSMNEVYNAVKILKPLIDKEEKLRLAFAKFMKSAQVLETALCNSVNVNKTKKAVSFRF